MNRRNLDIIINEYVRRFDVLNEIDGNDEGYKWRAETCFKQYWDIDAEAFPAMFKQAMKETSNLIDNATVQPIGGILLLLKHESEVEYVRECFRNLFSDDGGNLIQRQERIEEFAANINARLDRYVAGSWKYPQKINNVIYYLNLWKPEENYIFKSTEATAWAYCIEYEDDFGSGATFSLWKYYRMCDELLAELPNYPELMRLHQERAAREMQGYDDQLHILVYDIIYCAYAYDLYYGMQIEKVPAKERIKNAQLREAKEALQQQIVMKQQELLALSSDAIELPDLVGKQMRSKAYGIGTVVSCTGDILALDFSGVQKKFKYPGALTQGFLVYEDTALLESLKRAEEAAKQRAWIEKEIEAFQNRLASM